MCDAPATEKCPEVLVVDDDASVRSTYRRLLVRSGYGVRMAGDPVEVLSDDDSTAGVAVILLDYKMPSMDGLTMLAELRRRGCRARCILLSAYLNDDVRGRAGLLGVDAILEKPVDVRRLRDVLADLAPGAGPTLASAVG